MSRACCGRLCDRAAFALLLKGTWRSGAINRETFILHKEAPRLFALVLGAFLLIEGIWGLFSPVVFGVLTTNTTHAVIHIVLGVAGIWTSLQGGTRPYTLFVSILLLAVGVLRFVPGVGDLIVNLLNVNPDVAMVNI